MKKIIVSAPGKLMLLGEHAVMHNRHCLVTAVNQRMYSEIEFINYRELWLDAEDVEIYKYHKPFEKLGIGDIPKNAKFVEAALKNVIEKYDIKYGLKIKMKSEYSSKLGLGSSSSSTVCVIKALSELLELHLSRKEIFDLSYKTILDVQGKGSGFDIASVIYGGTIFFKTGGNIIEGLNIGVLPVVVGFTGIKADTVTLIDMVNKKAEIFPEEINQVYGQIEKLVLSGKEALLKNEWQSFGKIMNSNQKYLEELDISTEELNSLITAAREAGAYGAKLSGAGGGDCMIAVVSDERKGQVIRAIENAGGKIINIDTGAPGVRVETSI